MTTLADEIEALAKAVEDTYGWGDRDGAIFAIGVTVHNNLPTILRALRERDQAVEEISRLKARIAVLEIEANGPPPPGNAKSVSIFYLKSTSIEGTGHE